MHTHRTKILRTSLALFALCALSLGAVCALPQDACAQDDLDKLIKSNASDRQEAPTGADGKLKGPTVERVQLNVKWGLRRAANNEEAKDRLFQDYLDTSRELGDPNHPQESYALIQEGRDAIEQGNRGLAEKRFQQAQMLSPDLPSPVFAQLHNTFATNPADFTSILKFTQGGYTRAIKRTLPTRVTLQTNTAFSLSLAFFALFAIFSLALLIRALPFLATDTLRFLPNGIAPFQAMLAWLLILTIPILILNSPLLSFVLLIIAFSMYMRWTERVVAIALLLALSALPTTGQHTSPGIAWDTSSTKTLWEASYMACDQECAASLEKPLPGEKNLPDLTRARDFLRYTVALRQDPIGKASEIESELLKIASKTDQSPEMQSAVYTNIGVAQAIQGKLTQAEASMRNAVELQPKNAYAHLNVARVFELAKNGDAQQTSLKTALKLGDDNVAKRAQTTNHTVAAWFSLGQLPSSTLYAILQNEITQTQILSVWVPLLGSLPMSSLQPLCWSALGLLLLFSLLSLPLRSARACPRCDSPTSTKVPDPYTQHGATCGVCNALDKRAIKAYHKRTRHEAQINRAKTVRPLLFRIGNLLFPGLGGAILGHATGIVLILIACIGLGFLSIFEAPLASTWTLSTITRDPNASVFFITTLPAWAISLLWGILGRAEPPALPRDPKISTASSTASRSNP